MSEQELERQDVSEDTGSEDKLVPVMEAIRYRKRAQAAEKELADMKAERQALEAELAQVRVDQQIEQLLTGAGAMDLETASLLVRQRLADDQDAQPQEIVEQLRKDKAYLFTAQPKGSMTKTAGVRHEAGGDQALQSAADRAARSGSRVDVQEYLRIRRRFV